MDESSNRSKALLIGIQYKDQRYGNKSLELKGPCEDVKEMKKYLISTWDYPEDNILELIEEPDHLQPTRTNILKCFNLLLQASTPKTRLFLYYSGHGYQVRTDSKTELDGTDETLVPLDWKDNGLICDNVLYDLVVNRLPLGCRFTAVFDCSHSGTLLDLPYTREDPPLMRPDFLPKPPVITMYYPAGRQASTSSPPEAVPDVRQGARAKIKSGKTSSTRDDVRPNPQELTVRRQASTSSLHADVRQGARVKKKAGKKFPPRAMTYPPNPQEVPDSLTRSLKEYKKLPKTKALVPKAHWFKKWFGVFRKPGCAVDINTEYSIAFLAPLTSTLAATYPREVGYSLGRQSIGIEDVDFISPIESINDTYQLWDQLSYQLPWELPTQTSEEPASRSLDIQRKRFSEDPATLSIRGISDPLLLPTVYSIGACADSEEVMGGRTTNAGLLRSALIQCLAGTQDRTWEQLLEDLWEFTKSSPEFHSQTEIWPVIGSIKKELTDIVAF